MSDDGKVNLGHATPQRQTAKALLVLLELDACEHWIPQSVIDADSECYSVKGGAGGLIVARWFTDKEGL